MILQDNILPGATIGILGGGQLGRMLAMEAKRMGYEVHIYDPTPGGPAAQISGLETNASFEDEAALKKFFTQVDVVTFEFENIPTAALEKLEKSFSIHPRVDILKICQNRVLEKKFVASLGIRTAPFEEVSSQKSIEEFVAQHGAAILKTAEFGYDGKGQQRVDRTSNLVDAWKRFGAQSSIVESVVPFDREVSVLCARNRHGEVSTFPVTENDHHHQILHTSVVPAALSASTQREAERIARQISETLGLIGLICVEMFVVGEELYVNELAPRPHNSGHYTLDYCQTSQFEQQIRAICGLPLGDTSMLTPAACMINLLGDTWSQAKDGRPLWDQALKTKTAVLHLYGKKEAKVGRKMGHICTSASSADEAIRRAKEAKHALTKI